MQVQDANISSPNQTEKGKAKNLEEAVSISCILTLLIHAFKEVYFLTEKSFIGAEKSFRSREETCTREERAIKALVAAPTAER